MCEKGENCREKKRAERTEKWERDRSVGENVREKKRAEGTEGEEKERGGRGAGGGAEGREGGSEREKAIITHSPIQ
jgi:hypothetical protein